MFAQEEFESNQDNLSSLSQNGFLKGIELGMAVAVLEECIEKFAIVGAKLPEVEVKFSMKGIKERSLEPMYGLKTQYMVYDNEDDELIFHKLKLSTELHQAEKVLTIVKDELKSERSFYTLSAYNQGMQKIQQEEEDLIKMHKLLLNGGGTASTNRHLKEKLKYELIKLENEKNSLKLLQDSLEYWIRTYKNDIEDRNNFLAKLETQINDLRISQSSLTIEFQRRKNELDDYLVIRAERIRQQELEDLRNSAATKIQAWWRGCMVRWELGQYSSDMGKRRKRKQKKK
ncbi:dynein regulatory complex protein 9 isoform X2 [Halyomorpha halys]|uniref:dynein regulatory complex protein 9 isoform X2 n=1 Tax=Halyomorpha halys TaxID=286706 RepID=UPI0006D4D0DB|nr:IQ domain-containing protein G-like [Halyomorpha halys]